MTYIVYENPRCAKQVFTTSDQEKNSVMLLYLLIIVSLVYNFAMC